MIVTVDEVKTHLRIQYDDEDAYLESLIKQAQATAEDYCRVQFPKPAPEPVRLAVLLFVSHYYENRDNPDRVMYATMRIAFVSLLIVVRRASSMRAASSFLFIIPLPYFNNDNTDLGQYLLSADESTSAYTLYLKSASYWTCGSK